MRKGFFFSLDDACLVERGALRKAKISEVSVLYKHRLAWIWVAWSPFGEFTGQADIIIILD
jgi:hypothetical protein